MTTFADHIKKIKGQGSGQPETLTVTEPVIDETDVTSESQSLEQLTARLSALEAKIDGLTLMQTAVASEVDVKTETPIQSDAPQSDDAAATEINEAVELIDRYGQLIPEIDETKVEFMERLLAPKNMSWKQWLKTTPELIARKAVDADVIEKITV